MKKKLMSKGIPKYLNLYRELYGNEIYLKASTLNIENNFHHSKTSSNDLHKYLESIKDCVKCQLSKTRNNIVLGSGNPNAEIVFLDISPGKDEDLQGFPLVGDSGKLLDKMLSSINLNRDSVYILSVLKCNLPEDRSPLHSEINECEPYLKKQLEIIKPRLIVSLGKASANIILNKKSTIAELRKNIFNYQGIDLLVTYHPKALLQSPNFKKSAWEDFKLIRDKYIYE